MAEATPGGAVSYVAGYWKLPGNAKRPVEHYIDELPRSLAMIAGRPLLLYHEDAAIADAVAALCAPLGIELRRERVALQELPAYGYSAAFAAACRATPRTGPGTVPASRSEKGYVHLTRDLEGSGEETYRALIAIWMSKVPLMAQAAAAARAGQPLAWMDVSIARFNGQRTNWDFPRQAFAPGALNHYASPMRYRGERLPLNASFMLATPAVWAEVAEGYQAELEACLAEAYGHDEETILGRVHRRRPELFHTLGVPHALTEAAAPSGGARLVRRLKRRLLAALGRRP